MQFDIFESSERVNLANDRSDINHIPGLIYEENFISDDEHRELWLCINRQPWLADIKRRVQHYGWRYDYKARAIDYSMYLGELPPWAQPLAKRLFEGGYFAKEPDQLIINEYQPGQGIAGHVDCEPCFGSTIASVSLGSVCVMDFVSLKSREKIEILLEPKSLVVISGEARYDWTHGIAARKWDNFKGCRVRRNLRISMTFRQVMLHP